MNYGIERLDTLPLSLRLIREVHSKLVKDVRSAHRNPGELRNSELHLTKPERLSFLPGIISDPLSNCGGWVDQIRAKLLRKIGAAR